MKVNFNSSCDIENDSQYDTKLFGGWLCQEFLQNKKRNKNRGLVTVAPGGREKPVNTFVTPTGVTVPGVGVTLNLWACGGNAGVPLSVVMCLKCGEVRRLSQEK